MKLILPFALFFSICFSAVAQSVNFSVTGTIVDSLTAKPVEFAVVSLQQTADAKIITAGTTAADGNFLLQAPAGNYKLVVNLVGYRQINRPLEIKGDTKLGNISFAADAQTLGEAVVTTEKNVITRNSEKTVFNVAQSPTNQTGTAEDVLRNMPGVSVDQNGNVSIVGKSGVKVLVDGRPNALAEHDLASFLKSIPANSIEAIELITNPGARYDAEGTAGIINIKLKKGKADGLNANVSASYGFFNRYNANAAFNYRKSKFNLFGSYSFNYNKNANRYIETRTIGVNDTTTHYDLDSKGQSTNMNNSLKLGFDYFIDDKNTFTYTLSGNYNPSRWQTNAVAENRNAADQVLARYESNNDERNQNYSITNDVAYQKKFDTTEQELDINLTHTYVNGWGNSPLQSLAYDTLGVYDESNSLIRRTNTKNYIHNAIFQLDYTQPLKWAGHKLETGIKDELTLNRNIFNAYHTPPGSAEVKDSLLSNNFNYTENIAAFYLIYSGAYKEFLSWSAGVRAEQTLIKSNNSSISRQYVSFFPSATLTGNISEMQSISLSYSRRIERPGFHQINNSVTYIDQYSTWQGNPQIQPSFSNELSLEYTIMTKKHMFSIEAEGSLQTGDFIESSRVDSNRITRGGIINGSDHKHFDLSFYYRLQITKWWQLQMNHNYSYNYYSYRSGVNTQPIGGHSYNLWLSTNFKFWKSMVLEINGWLNTGGVQPQGKSYPAGMLNASLKKSFFKDQFTVGISATNILNTLKWHWTVNNTNLMTEGRWQALNRAVYINLSYRFGKKVQDHKLNSNDRLGGGGNGGGSGRQ